MTARFIACGSLLSLLLAGFAWSANPTGSTPSPTTTTKSKVNIPLTTPATSKSTTATGTTPTTSRKVNITLNSSGASTTKGSANTGNGYGTGNGAQLQQQLANVRMLSTYLASQLELQFSSPLEMMFLDILVLELMRQYPYETQALLKSLNSGTAPASPTTTPASPNNTTQPATNSSQLRNRPQGSGQNPKTTTPSTSRN